MGQISDNNTTGSTGNEPIKKDSVIVRFFKRIGKFLRKHIKLCIFLVILLVIILYVRNSYIKARDAIVESMNQPTTANVEKMDLQQSVSVTGTLTANETATVTSTIGGTGVTGVKVSAVNYKEGDYVEAGTVIVEFDGDDYDRKLAELTAQNNITNLESTQNIEDLQQKIDTITEQIADDQQWLDDNRSIYENLKDAFEQYEKYKDTDQSVVNRWNRESAAAAALAEPVTITTYEAKEDSIEDQQRQIEIYQNQIQLAQLKQDYATTYTQVDEFDNVYESMDKTKVVAPISGYILTMNVEEGNNYTQGNTVFTLADTSGFYVEATVNEYDVANIKTDLPAVVKFEATGDDEFSGDVSFVAVASESVISGNAASSSSLSSAYSTTSTSGSTATYKIKIQMNDNDDRFRVGMTAKASVILNSVENVLAVPYDCIQQEDDGTFFVNEIAEDGTETKIPVTKGLESDYFVEVSGEGLEEGMAVEAILTDSPSTDVMDYFSME